MTLRTQEALEIIKEIEGNIQSLEEDTYERGQEFFDSISDKANSFRQGIEEKGYATRRQVEALENMLRGVEKWLN